MSRATPRSSSSRSTELLPCAAATTVAASVGVSSAAGQTGGCGRDRAGRGERMLFSLSALSFAAPAAAAPAATAPTSAANAGAAAFFTGFGDLAPGGAAPGLTFFGDLAPGAAAGLVFLGDPTPGAGLALFGDLALSAAAVLVFLGDLALSAGLAATFALGDAGMGDVCVASPAPASSRAETVDRWPLAAASVSGNAPVNGEHTYGQVKRFSNGETDPVTRECTASKGHAPVTGEWTDGKGTCSCNGGMNRR